MHRFATYLKHPMDHLEWFVAIIGLTFGLAFLVAIPPMQGADETNHFLRAYQISEGKLTAEYVGQSRGGISVTVHNYDYNVGGNLPRGIVDFTFGAFQTVPHQGEQKMAADGFKKIRTYRVTGPDRSAAAFGNTAAYSPVAYVPQVVAIVAGNIVHAPPYVLFYLARLVGLIFGVAALALAVRIIPFGKLPLAIFGLLPMTIAQFAIVTADTTAIASGFLLVAVALNFAFRDRGLANRDIAVLIGLCGFLGLAKPSLLPLTLLCFALLRNPRINRRKAFLVAAGGVVTTVILALAWNFLVKDMVVLGFHLSYPKNDYAAQLSYIIHEPWNYLRVLLATFLTHDLDYSTVSLIGYFGWGDTPLPQMWAAFGYVLLALGIFASSQHQAIKMPRWVRWLAGLAIAGVLIFTATYMYLFCDAPKDSYIQGLQGRYYLPIAAVVSAFAVGKKQWLNDRHFAAIARVLLYGSVVLLAGALCVIVGRFYNVTGLF